MNELANAIAHFVRRANKDLTVKVERVQRSNARVTVDGSIIDVEWFRGGARVSGRRFFYDTITKQYDIDEIVTYVAEILVERKKQRELQRQREEQAESIKHVRDAVAKDPRISVYHNMWSDNKRPFSIVFKTANLTSLSMVADFLLDFGDVDDAPSPKPTLATARYTIKNEYSHKLEERTLRQLACIYEMSEETWNAVLTMPVGNVVMYGDKAITRIS